MFTLGPAHGVHFRAPVATLQTRRCIVGAVEVVVVVGVGGASVGVTESNIVVMLRWMWLMSNLSPTKRQPGEVRASERPTLGHSQWTLEQSESAKQIAASLSVVALALWRTIRVAAHRRRTHYSANSAPTKGADL